MKHIEKKNKKNKMILISILIIVMSCLLTGGVFLYQYIKKGIDGEEKYLNIELLGDKNIILNYKDKYTDKGAKATYKTKDITSDIDISNNIDYEKLGNYTYTYKIKYKKQEKEIKRNISIVDKEKPKLVLKGKNNITLTVGDIYKDEGVKVSDNYDKDLSKEVKVDSKVNTKKEGTYKLVYKVKDSSGNSSSISRTVKVKPKPIVKKNTTSSASFRPGIAVINYHFFYENKSEGCNEGLCLKMSRFREQLDYLKDNGFKTLTMQEFVDYMYGKIDVPKKSVLITIDDGAHGTSKINGNHLIPTLEKYKMHATLFLITGWWDIKNYYSPYLDIQSHTHNLHFEGTCKGHRSKVNCVSYNDLLNDLKKSLKVVKSNLSFCFPFYEYTEKSIKAVKDAGFKIAFVGENKKKKRSDNKYKIPRYPINDYTTLDQFIRMVN